jgi:hypothetical protein
VLKRNAILAAKLTIIASLFATNISSWQNYSVNGYVGWHSFANGMVDGFLIVGFLSTYKLIVSDVLLRRFFARLSFVRTLILNSIAYSFLILFGRALGRFIMEYEHFVLLPTGTDIARQHFYQTLGAALIFLLLLNFLLQNSRLLGPRVLLPRGLKDANCIKLPLLIEHFFPSNRSITGNATAAYPSFAQAPTSESWLSVKWVF